MASFNAPPDAHSTLPLSLKKSRRNLRRRMSWGLAGTQSCAPAQGKFDPEGLADLVKTQLRKKLSCLLS